MVVGLFPRNRVACEYLCVCTFVCVGVHSCVTRAMSVCVCARVFVCVCVCRSRTSCVFAAGLCAAGTGHDDPVMYNQG